MSYIHSHRAPALVLFYFILFYCLYICLDFIQGACTESLDGQLQGAITHPPHPLSL